MSNTSVKIAIAIYQAAVAEIEENNKRMMAFFDRKAKQAIEDLQGTQSEGLGAGYVPDDARDFKAAIVDLCNDMQINFDCLKSDLSASTKAVIAKVESADGQFERIEKVDTQEAMPATP